MKNWLEREADIEAVVFNGMSRKTPFSTGYRPAFDVHKRYSTSGVIKLIDREYMNNGEIAYAYISFITPKCYPKCLWVDKKIIFREGKTIIGHIVVTRIFNKILESNEQGVEGELNKKGIDE